MPRAASGTVMTRWPRVHHVCSGLGRWPQHQISGGKGVTRRLQARLGTPQALTATAHTRARLVSPRLTQDSPSVHQGLDADAAPDRARQVTTLAKPAQALGETLVPLTAQGEHGPPRPPSGLLRLVHTTGCEGQGRAACPQPSHRGHTPSRGASKTRSTSQTTSHPPRAYPKTTSPHGGVPWLGAAR